jgi:hypothetical protein
MVQSMERSDVPYLLVGAAAAAQRRSAAALGLAFRATEIAAAPAVLVWRSPPAGPVRRRASEVTVALTEDGRQTVISSREAAGGVVRRVGTEVSQSGVVEDAVDRLIAAGVIERIVSVVVNHPATLRMVDGVLDDPAIGRLVTRILESATVEDLTTRILESDEMQMALEHITRSPELRAALAQQTAGLATDMAVSVRSRTFVADDVAERAARGLFRRKQRPRIP